jgi:hypothetical protein
MVNILEVHFKHSIELTPEKIDSYFSKYYIPTGILELRTIENENKIYSFETMITYDFAIRAICLLKDVLKEKINKLYFNEQNIPIEFL